MQNCKPALCFTLLQDRSIQTWKKCKLQQQQTLIPNESESNKRLKIEDLCNVANVSKDLVDCIFLVFINSIQEYGQSYLILVINK